MTEPKWQEINHTADLALRVRGDSWEDLLTNAARGMIDSVLDPEKIRPAQEKEVRANADTREGLIVEFLEEILFAFDAENFAPRNVELNHATEKSVRAILKGEGFNRERHEIRNAIKAVTWHQLEVLYHDGNWEVTIIFDV
ncbi:MAG: archease [Candidatus Brocadiia bacterium]